MPVVQFKATPDRKTWKHRPGGWKLVSSPTGDYRELVEPDIMADGEKRDMDDFDAAWAVSQFPANFSVVA